MPPLQPAILVGHPWMGRGGSEATAMGALDALQDLAKVTFTTASPVDWDSLNAAYGTRVSPEGITFRPAPRLPGTVSAGSNWSARCGRRGHRGRWRPGAC